MGNQVISHHDLVWVTTKEMEHYGMIRLDWCERDLRFGSFIKGGRSRLTDGRSDSLIAGEFWINIMIPHTCITDGVFSFSLGWRILFCIEGRGGLESVR